MSDTGAKRGASNIILLSVYVLAILVGIIWLLHNFLGEGAKDPGANVPPLTIEEAVKGIESDLSGRVKIEAGVFTDLTVAKTSFELQPYTTCRVANELKMHQAMFLFGQLNYAVGCLLATDSEISKAHVTTTTATPETTGTTASDDPLLVRSVIQTTIKDQPLWIVSPLRKLAATGPVDWLTQSSYTGRLVFLDSLAGAPRYQDVWNLAAPPVTSAGAEPTAIRDSPKGLALLTDPKAVEPVLAERKGTYTPVAGSNHRVFVRNPGIGGLPDAGPVEGTARTIRAEQLSFTPIFGLGPDTEIAVIEFAPMEATLKAREAERRQNSMWAACLIVVGILGLLKSRERKAAQVKLYTSQRSEPEFDEELDEEQIAAPEISADEIPDERHIDLIARTTTLKDWIMALDEDRRQFVRTCIVKWTGKSDSDHIQGMQTFLTACVASLLDEFEDESTPLPDNEQERLDTLLHLANRAAGRVEDNLNDAELEILATARYMLKKQPALAALSAARPLRWFAKVGAEALSLPRKQV